MSNDYGWARGLRSTCLLLTLVAAAAAAAPATGDRGLRFDGPGVLDLAERSQTISGGMPVPVVELAGADAERIFAAPAMGDDPPLLRFSDDEFGCARPSRPCFLEHERGLIASAAGAVKREGKRLTVAPVKGPAATFIDWNASATKIAEGDAETHWYLGRLAGSGYERVEVQFGHDAPGNFIINPQNGKVAFVHNGADLVAPSPDGALLVTWNALNPPLSLRVAALDDAGPRLVLQCAAPEGGERLTPVFKGWIGPAAFDLVVEIGEQRKAMVRLALEAAEQGDGWRLAASNPGTLERLGLNCRNAGAR